MKKKIFIILATILLLNCKPPLNNSNPSSESSTQTTTSGKPVISIEKVKENVIKELTKSGSVKMYINDLGQDQLLKAGWGPIVLVNDEEPAKQIGENEFYDIGYEGGLALYKKSFFQEIAGNITVTNKSNNFVLYFEYNNLEEYEKKINENEFLFIHKTREQPWGQRVFRFYDYDNHIIEMAEAMSEVFKRLYHEHKTIKEIARKTGYLEDQVKIELAKWL